MRRAHAIFAVISFALAAVTLGGCSRSLATPGEDDPSPRFYCVNADLGAQASVVRNASTDTGSNSFVGSCGGAGSEQIYRWVAPTTGIYEIRVSGTGSDLDTVLYLYNGSCDAPELACNDDFGSGLGSRIDVDAEAGVELVIVVDTYDEQPGPFTLMITPRG